jgi:hypothetical protein
LHLGGKDFQRFARPILALGAQPSCFAEETAVLGAFYEDERLFLPLEDSAVSDVKILRKKPIQFLFTELVRFARPLDLEESHDIKCGGSGKSPSLQTTVKDEQIAGFQASQSGFRRSWVSVSEGIEFRIDVHGLISHLFPHGSREKFNQFSPAPSYGIAVGPFINVVTIGDGDVLECPIGEERTVNTARAGVDADSEKDDVHSSHFAANPR